MGALATVGLGGDDEDDRHAHTHAGEGQIAIHRHMADIDTVYHVVEHIDELCHHGRNRKAEQ